MQRESSLRSVQLQGQLEMSLKNRYRNQYGKLASAYEKLSTFLSSKQIQSSLECTVNSENGSWYLKQRRSQLGNFLRIYFRFMYYLGVCPFLMIKDTGTGYYYPRSYLPQQIICGIVTALGLINLIAHVRAIALPDSVSELQTKNPIPYFQILLGCFNLFCQCILTKRFWFNFEEYVAVLNAIEKEDDLPVRKSKLLSPYFCYTLFGFTSVELVVSLVLGFSFVTEPLSTWTPSWWLRRLVELSRYAFWRGSKLTSKTTPPQLSQLTFWDGALTAVTLVGEIRRAVLYFFADSCILSSALTLWVTASSFAESVAERMKDERRNAWHDNGRDESLQNVSAHFRKVCKHDTQSPWPRFYRNFQAIYRLSQVVNVALGSQVTWYMAEGLMYYSANIHSIILTKDEFHRVRMIIFYVITGSILYVSADICAQLETVRCWLLTRKSMDNVRNDEAILVLHALNSADVGIRGSNLITLTYSLVAGYLSVIVTFFIISLQSTK